MLFLSRFINILLIKISHYLQDLILPEGIKIRQNHLKGEGGRSKNYTMTNIRARGQSLGHAIFSVKKTELSARFKDLYSFCEAPTVHAGFWKEEINDFYYEPDEDAIVYALDPKTRKVVKKGGRGLFQVISPYGCEYSCNSNIIQGDTIEVLETNEDGSVKAFARVERFPGLEIEGCAYEARSIVGSINK